ncbi:MAG: HAMP domain-containing sensor histidine kinase [Solirubrobacteraceae bacterium]
MLERVYARHGVRGLVVLATVAVTTNIAVIVAVIAASLLRFIDAGFDEFVKIAALTEGLVLVCIPGTLFACRGFLRTLWSWSGEGRQPPHAPEVWRAALEIPRRLVTIAGIVMFVPASGAVGLALSDLHESAWLAVPALVALGGCIAANCVFVMFGIELTARPLVEDVATFLPSGFDPGVRALRLRTRVMAPIPGAILFASVVEAGVATLHTSHLLRTTILVGLAVCIVAVAVGLFRLATGAALDPIDELTRATDRVRAGHLDTPPVPVVTADELGTLTHSFNEMVAGLRDRERLQAHNVELVEEVRASRERIVATADEERRRLERDLHDGAQQHLVLLGLKLGIAERLVDQDPAAVTETLGELRRDLDRALAELRNLAHGIYPAVLENEGLSGALGEAAQRAAIPTRLECDGTGRYRPELEAAVYFCCLEALQNAAKHAGAGASATVRIGEHNQILTFEVADDGSGFDLPVHLTSAGLQNMNDRIGALRGTLEVTSAPGKGTAVAGAIPLDRPT